VHRLALQERLQAFDAALTPDTGLAVAPEGRRDVRADEAVDLHRSRPNALGDPVGALHVVAEDGPAETVGGVVRDGDGVVDVLVREDADDWPEYLLLATRIEFSTSTSTVGSKKKPFSRCSGRFPPTATRAPSAAAIAR